MPREGTKTVSFIYELDGKKRIEIKYAPGGDENRELYRIV